MKKMIILSIGTAMLSFNAIASNPLNWNYSANLIDWDPIVQTGWLVQMYKDVNNDSALGSLAFDTVAADGTFTGVGNGSDDILLGAPLLGSTDGLNGIFVAFSYSGLNASVVDNSSVYTVLFNAATIGAATHGVILDASTKSLLTGAETYSINGVSGSWQAVPEPATAMLLAVGGGFAWLVRKKQRII